MLSRVCQRATFSGLRQARKASQRGFAANAIVLADHDNAKLLPSTLNSVSAASQLGGSVTVLVAGKGCGAVAKQASKVAGVSKVVVAEDAAYEHGVAENLTLLLNSLHKKNNYSHIIAGSTAVGRSAIPRLAAQLDVAPVSDVTAIKGEDTFVHPVYAGNAVSTVKSKDATKLLTVRSTAFPAAQMADAEVGVESFSAEKSDAGLSTWVKDEVSKSERPELTSARVVVAGGRAMEKPENFEMLYKLADKLGGAVGASRAAVDAGMAPNELQVGQTGKVVAPQLYIAVGISGAIQHLAGMKDSKTIVAINKDADAPIFQVADYGLVADLFKAVPELTESVGK